MAAKGTTIWLAAGGAFLLLALAGCGAATVKKTEKLPAEKILPLRTASLEELLTRLEEQEAAIVSINAVAVLVPSTGSAYSGVIEEYHDLRAFLLAQRQPAAAAGDGRDERRQVRVVGQAPLVRKTIFDMAADEAGFRVLLPTKNKFIVGSNEIRRPRQKAIENLRPQHLFDAVFFPGPNPSAPHLLEENEFDAQRFYAVSEIAAGGGGRWWLARKWWFDRSGLALARAQRFLPDGRLVSDVHYAGWEAGTAPYPRQIVLVRPQEDYRLKLVIKEIRLNEALAPEKFRLEQPADTELVDLNEEEPPEGRP